MDLPVNKAESKKLFPQLALIAVLMLAGMTFYEILKQKIFPDISIWQSHVVTIIFATICAIVAGFFIIRNHFKLTEKLVAKNIESEGLAVELENTVKRLEVSLSEINILTGLLPICSSCKRIKDDKGNWIQIEKYISERAEVNFSHGLCEECIIKLYPDLFKEILDKK